MDRLIQNSVNKIRQKAQQIFAPQPTRFNSIGQSRPNIPQQRPIQMKPVQMNPLGQSKPNIQQTKPIQLKPIANKVVSQIKNPQPIPKQAKQLPYLNQFKAGYTDPFNVKKGNTLAGNLGQFVGGSPIGASDNAIVGVGGLIAGAGAKGFKGAPGKFASRADKMTRFEIPDNKMDLKKSGFKKLKQGGLAKLDELIDHKELFENYPQLRRVLVDKKDLGDSAAQFGGNRITLNPLKNKDKKTTKETILHEVQHAIQDVEGFAKGGDASKIGNKAYRNLAGEVEARAVEARRIMTPKQRETIDPYLGGPKLEEMITNFNTGVAGKSQPIKNLKNAAKQIDDEISGPLPRAKLSTQAMSEGITVPRKGSDIAVRTQAGIKHDIRKQKEFDPIKDFEINVLGKTDTRGQSKLIQSSPLGKMQQSKDTRSLNRAQVSSSSLDTQGLPKVTIQPGESFDDIIGSRDLNVKNKVNIIDYLRTPDRVLGKMGLKRESDLIRKKYDDYLDELPKEIDKVTAWRERVSPESNQRIFKYLDGQPMQLDPNELKVATEIKDYLKEWAVRLKLPKESRISNYITHIFEKDFIQKEFDPEIAALIRDKVPGSVYDPFTERRLGAAGYVEDTWRALDAYVKRGTRKVHMDEALEQLSSKSQALEDSQFNYIKRYVDKINMRPGQIDQLLDNAIKSAIGYKLGQRPVSSISRKLRQAVYRGTLGLNVGSALRNLTQGANTYAKLGEKYTALGYYKLAKAMAAGDDELERVGILRDNFIQDRTLSASSKAWEKLDKGLWAFFNAAEKVNRGSAYFGAKAQALSKGATEAEAIQAGKNMVRDTQFTFGSVDTPQLLQSDITKTLLQFQSFNLKQTEFLIEMAKNKEFAGLARFGIASTAMLVTVGQLLNMKPTDFIPFYGVATGDTKLGQTPPVKLAMDVAKTVTGAKDQYGQQPDLGDRVDTFTNDLVPFIPGGVQIKKTVDALGDYARGYDETPSGKVKYPIEQNPSNLVRGALFGSNKLPVAQDYYNKERSPLSDNQSTAFKESDDPQGQYNSLMENRDKNKATDELKATVKESGESEVVDDKIIYFDKDSGQTRTVSLTPKENKGSGIDAFDTYSGNSAKAREIWQIPDSQLSKQEKEVAFKKLGYTPDQVRYDYISSSKFSSQEKANYIMSKDLSHEQLIERLKTGRVESVSGNYFANQKTLDILRDEGLISDAEYSALNKLKMGTNGKVKSSSGKAKIKKPKKVKIKKIKISKGKTIKLKGLKSKKAKSAKSLMLTPPKQGKPPKIAKLKVRRGT